MSGVHLDLGYLHRGTEKLSEGEHLYQNVAYMDRLDYVSALHMEHLLAAAVETLLGVGVPQRAGHLRVAFMELARVAQLPCHGQ